MNLSKSVRYSSKYPKFNVLVEKTQSERNLVPNLLNYQLLEEEKIILVGKILSFQIICLSFLENLLEFFLA